MIFNNLMKERRDKKINSLPKEIQRKLKRAEMFTLTTNIF